MIYVLNIYFLVLIFHWLYNTRGATKDRQRAWCRPVRARSGRGAALAAELWWPELNPGGYISTPSRTPTRFRWGTTSLSIV